MNRPLRLTGCSLRVSLCECCVIPICSQYFGSLLAAVGADLSCPHIRIHPRNVVRKCMYDGTNVRIFIM
ncbi:hypothetical protein [Prevotella pallens]|uniref:hypothetical protein n=1 Tax=Prevotella pallens TaxID=60133 RepID=UPI001CAD30DC|nr:hypothetical protein [Prevotella pallens]MBF1483288.1 hypothetical protein [Prevotella pallens]